MAEHQHPDPRPRLDWATVMANQAMWGRVSDEIQAIAVEIAANDVDVALYFAVSETNERVREEIADIADELDSYLYPFPANEITVNIHVGPPNADWPGYQHEIIYAVKQPAHPDATEPVSYPPSRLQPHRKLIGITEDEDLRRRNDIVLLLIQALVWRVTPQIRAVSIDLSDEQHLVLHVAVSYRDRTVDRDIDDIAAAVRDRLQPDNPELSTAIFVGIPGHNWPGYRVRNGEGPENVYEARPRLTEVMSLARQAIRAAGQGDVRGALIYTGADLDQTLTAQRQVRATITRAAVRHALDTLRAGTIQAGYIQAWASIVLHGESDDCRSAEDPDEPMRLEPDHEDAIISVVHALADLGHRNTRDLTPAEIDELRRRLDS
jgi:hypothetical protein